jgi:hypothetical protein
VSEESVSQSSHQVECLLCGEKQRTIRGGEEKREVILTLKK